MDAPLKYLYDVINKGTNAEKMDRLPDFPHMVDIELTNTCNLKCKMCPTGTDTTTRRKGFMSLATASQVAIECAKHYTPIRLIRWGESMLSPDCFRIVRLIKSFGLKCHMNTNGTLVDFDTINDIISSGLDSIKFSFQGVDSEEYSTWRSGGDYIRLCGWIKHLYVQRGQQRKRHPYIQIGTTVTSSTNDMAIDAFCESMGKICDDVSVGKTENIINPGPVKETPRCPEVFDRISVSWDGTVTACCRDYDNLLMLGNIKHQTIQEMWHGKSINRIRQYLLNGEHNKLPVCRSCFLGAI